jgi:hypothetical protein
MIKININGVWTLAGDKYTSMFQKYVNQNRLYREVPYIEDGITISRDSNDPYNASYIHIGNHKIPICDWNNVKVFLLEMEPVDWHNARDYQTWAYYDFMYDNKVKKTYISPGSSYIQDSVVIDNNQLSPNIVFSISRNDNNSVYYEKNDVNRTHVRICDNDWPRIGYRGFYNRMTMDPGIIITPPVNNTLQNSILIPDNILIVPTDNLEDQCIMCCTYKSNIQFIPCNHTISCAECCKKMANNKCPICKTDILSVINI